MAHAYNTQTPTHKDIHVYCLNCVYELLINDTQFRYWFFVCVCCSCSIFLVNLWEFACVRALFVFSFIETSCSCYSYHNNNNNDNGKYLTFIFIFCCYFIDESLHFPLSSNWLWIHRSEIWLTYTREPSSLGNSFGYFWVVVDKTIWNDFHNLREFSAV